MFQETPRTIDAILDFKKGVEEYECVTPIIADIHVCEFTGFLDDAQATVGCMLHPMASGNNGTDWRGLCHYGAMACKTFFCPSCDELTENEASILIKLIDDWYLYGLVITDVNFVRAIFNYISVQKGRGMVEKDALKSAKTSESLYDLISMKAGPPEKSGPDLCESRYHMKLDIGFGTDSADQCLDLIVKSICESHGTHSSKEIIKERVLSTLQSIVSAL
jgi:hypothetical protein